MAHCLDYALVLPLQPLAAIDAISAIIDVPIQL
jgi:hypothetical protein